MIKKVNIIINEEVYYCWDGPNYYKTFEPSINDEKSEKSNVILYRSNDDCYLSPDEFFVVIKRICEKYISDNGEENENEIGYNYEVTNCEEHPQELCIGNIIIYQEVYHFCNGKFEFVKEDSE